MLHGHPWEIECHFFQEIRETCPTCYSWMIYRVTRQRVELDTAKAKSAELGFDFDQKPLFKAAMEKYFALSDSNS